jgi:hypothetical protein
MMVMVVVMISEVQEQSGRYLTRNNESVEKSAK